MSFHRQGFACLPPGVDCVQAIDRAIGYPGIQDRGDSVRSARNVGGLRWHGAGPGGTMPRSAATATPRVPTMKNVAVARSGPTAPSTRSLNAPAKPCSAHISTIARRAGVLDATGTGAGIRANARSIAAAKRPSTPPPLRSGHAFAAPGLLQCRAWHSRRPQVGGYP